MRTSRLWTVDPTHKAGLETLVSTFSTAVALEMRCDLADAPTGEPQNHEVFRTHFPVLDISLERWNAAIDHAQTAPEMLWRWFASSAREQGITEPPFMVGALIDHLATWTLQRSRRWQLGAPHETLLQYFNDRLGHSTYVSVYLMGRRVAMLPGGPEPDVRRRVEAADALIQALFDEARDCEEAQQIADTRDSLLDLKQRLLDDLELRRAIASIEFAPDCPRCRTRDNSQS